MVTHYVTAGISFAFALYAGLAAACGIFNPDERRECLSEAALAAGCSLTFGAIAVFTA